MPFSKPSAAARLARERAGRNATFHFNARLPETVLLLFASLLVVLGLWRVYQAKQVAIAESEQRRELLNLNRVTQREELLPVLRDFPTEAERQFAARRIFDYLSGADSGRAGRRELANVGQLSTLRVSEAETQGMESYRQRFEELRKNPTYRAAELAPSPWERFVKWLRGAEETPLAVSLLTGEQLREDLKPLVTVREAAEFRAAFWRSAWLFFAAFYGVHLLWWLCSFKGDGTILPAIHLLTGVGLMLMISLQDPLRDTLLFARFVSGVWWGVLLLGVIAAFDELAALVRRVRRPRAPHLRGTAEPERELLGPFLRGLGYLLPLLLSFLLSVLLLTLGSGPGRSAAKVNLLGVQPIEIIKPLLALFFAGYFSKHWLMMRETTQLRLGGVTLPHWIKLPRLQYLLPVLCALAAAMIFFVAQRDLGPALVITGLFLALYFTARDRAWLSLIGFGLLLAGFAGGYLLRAPATVYARVRMFLSPWENAVSGGDQVAHALWGVAAGGGLGTGLGRGRPGLMPEARTDLILAAVGEELGFVGLLAVFVLYAWLIYRGIRIARRAEHPHTFFLVFGLTLLTALQIALIAGGVLRLAPLSGVVSPFLSSGRSAMIAHLLIFGLILACSARSGAGASPEQQAAFRRPVRWLTVLPALLLVGLLAQAARVQLFRADETLTAAALVLDADGILNFAYNPRLLELRRLIPRGSVYDRSGLPLATSRWDELGQFRLRYQRLDVQLPARPMSSGRARYYPFGGLIWHLLGDWRTERNWGARNTSFVERDLNTLLQGFDDHAASINAVDPRNGKSVERLKRDYRELIPLWRHRNNLEHLAAKQLLERRHDVQLALDITLQKRLAEHLRRRIAAAKAERGAAVVLDAANGELLASVSYPWPASTARAHGDDDGEAAEAALLDRARYALRPPGSTFKLVTAVAALRKDPDLATKPHLCRAVAERDCIGNYVRGWGRAICDDESDVRGHPKGHGQVAMGAGLEDSCNAYFAQLGVYDVGAERLQETAKLFGISTSRAGTPAGLRESLSQAAYGQGQVTVTPYRLAAVSAMIANGGSLPAERWVLTRGERNDASPILNRDPAALLAGFMRRVVTSGTGTKLMKAPVPVAGKTGTAENNDPRSHSWFTGFAPFGPTTGRRIAFSVLVENGGYGAGAAADTVLDLITEAHSLDVIRQ